MVNNQYHLKRGVQVLYVPEHAQGDVTHSDVEEGFVTSIGLRYVFCRFWSKSNSGELRTKANSEAARLKHLVIQDTHTVEEIVEALVRWC